MAQRPALPTRISTRFQDVVEAVILKVRGEHDSAAHKVRVYILPLFGSSYTPSQIYRSAPGHQAHGRRNPDTTNPAEETVPGIVHPGSTGVIYCSDR